MQNFPVPTPVPDSSVVADALPSTRKIKQQQKWPSVRAKFFWLSISLTRRCTGASGGRGGFGGRGGRGGGRGMFQISLVSL